MYLSNLGLPEMFWMFLGLLLCFSFHVGENFQQLTYPGDPRGS